WRYGAGKFLSRHRLPVVAAGLAVVLLAGAAAALAVFYTRAAHARAQAEQARAPAEERVTPLRSLSRFLLFAVYAPLPSLFRARSPSGAIGPLPGSAPSIVSLRTPVRRRTCGST